MVARASYFAFDDRSLAEANIHPGSGGGGRSARTRGRRRSDGGDITHQIKRISAGEVEMALIIIKLALYYIKTRRAISCPRLDMTIA